MKKYFALETKEREADITIFGDITSWPWMESDVSSYNLSKQISMLDVDVINVHLNSYGGEVAEGLAIYNCLKQHMAKVKTYCDGFACSIASVIFMSGDERIMSNASALMIHNPWTYTEGNAQELRKTADDLDKMTQLSVNAYKEHVNISEDEIKQLLDEESWLTPQEALEYGFATIVTGAEAQAKYSQSVRKSVLQKLLRQKSDPKQKDEVPEEKENLMHLFAGISQKEGKR
ncbi:MAG: head maturation protease, ClpP-related [Lachnospiraceae bacterium]|uniref:head maturation protease, ClpP-related n=1 Tax=Parablautia sp. Marseille-Q6255 TaxID=3039593 RepID=UPI0024BC13C2|nr:head maturation protease, ClpP-related [Parablautia sp. Marseille-Q6255]